MSSVIINPGQGHRDTGIVLCRGTVREKSLLVLKEHYLCCGKVCCLVLNHGGESGTKPILIEV